MRTIKAVSTWIRCAVAAAFLASGATALAQQQSGLVNVNVSNVAVDLADLLDVNVSPIPVNVQVPIGVAANVCGVAANVLASNIAQTGDASCDATTTSTALARITQRQLIEQ